MLKKILVITVITLGLAAVARPQAFNKVALKINGKPVTLDEFNYLFTKNRDLKAAVDSQQLADYVNLFVAYKLKVEDALSRRMDTLSAFRNELAGYRAQLAAPYLTDTSADARVLSEAYSYMKSDIRASHILVALRPDATPADTLEAYNKALDIRSKVIANPAFDSLARIYSTDPSAKSNGGDLGYFTAFRMVYPFEKAAYKLAVGEVSAPVRTKFGYHIIKVTEKRPARGEVKVAHIMALVPKNGTEADWESGLARISSVREKIMRGADWVKAAAENSDDKGTANSGGEIPQFGIGRIFPVLEDAAFSMTTIGEVSQPVRTPVGWHILRLLEKHPVGSFEEVKADLKTKIARDERVLEGQASFVETLKRNYGYKVNQKNVDAVARLIDTTFNSGKWSAECAAKMGKPVFSYAKQKVSQYELAKYLGSRQGQNIADQKAFVDEAVKAMASEKMLAFESSKLDEKFPRFRYLMNEYHDGILLFDISDKTVWTKASKDTTGLAAFFEKSKAKYTKPLVVHAAVATFPDSASAMNARAGLLVMDLTLVPLDSLRSTLTSKYDGANFASGWYNPADHQLISLVNPLVKGVHYVETANHAIGLVVLDRVETNFIPPMDEVRGMVISEYQDELDRQWVEQLKAKYPVVVDWKAIYTLVTK